MSFFVSVLVLSVLSICGATNSGIIGGHEAKPHSRPYMASVQINTQHVCGGMLIRRNYVLTAAHCVDNFENSGKTKLEVVLGAHGIHQHETQQQRIQVKNYVMHPCYKKYERSDDIMLLKLKPEVKLNKFVKVQGLPKNNNIPVDQKCSIAGWGKTGENSSTSSVLREVTLIVENNTECKSLWQNYFDTDSMICTASDGTNAFCQGDSGSPLMCDKVPQGVAVYTYPGMCLNSAYPQVYMKISYYHEWIKQVIG